jgi:lipopolysaccharide exporter
MSTSPPEIPREPEVAEEALSSGEVKSRAAAGVAILMGRGVAFQVIGFLGSLVLARLLVPDDFGLVAIGLTIVNLGRYLANAGLAGALVLRPAAPERAELRAVTGLQLLVTSVVAVVAAAVAIAIGGDALVTASMMLALPLAAFRTPGLLLFQRRLDFKSQVKVEATEVIVNTAWAIAAAALGFGAWSLATALVVSAAAGTAVACIVSPAGFLAPSFRFSRVRAILGFGARFQASGVIHVGQDLALTAGIGAIGGLTALGLWNFAARILRVPLLLFESSFSVGFPAFSRLLGGEVSEDSARLLERSVGTVAISVTAILAPMVASAPALVPLLFGDVWEDVALILPGSALGLALAGPIGIAAYAYLYAIGDANTPLWATLLSTVARLATTFALLPSIGVFAIGAGWAVGACAELPVVAGQVRRASGARLVRQVLRPSLSAVLPTAGGWLVAESLGSTLPAALLALTIAAGGFAAIMYVFARQDLSQAAAMMRRVGREARKGFVRSTPKEASV